MPLIGEAIHARVFAHGRHNDAMRQSETAQLQRDEKILALGGHADLMLAATHRNREMLCRLQHLRLKACHVAMFSGVTETAGCANERNMRKGLRKIADQALAFCVVFL